jgi:hypothetical protein
MFHPIFHYSHAPLTQIQVRKEVFRVADQMEEKVTFDGKKVKVLGPTFEEGKPETPIMWRQKMRSREEMLAYLKTGERYWFSDEWYGSEKRKTKA